MIRTKINGLAVFYAKQWFWETVHIIAMQDIIAVSGQYDYNDVVCDRTIIVHVMACTI